MQNIDGKRKIFVRLHGRGDLSENMKSGSKDMWKIRKSSVFVFLEIKCPKIKGPEVEKKPEHFRTTGELGMSGKS